MALAPLEVQTRKTPMYDKLHKVRWLVDEICKRFQSMWNLDQQLMVDEGVIMYKRKYAPIRQYIPNKLVRFDLKVWATADSLSKYIWNFQIYCGREGNPHEDGSQCVQSYVEGIAIEDHVPKSGKDEGLQGCHVVKLLLKDLGGKGHIVTSDNFFSSVPLVLDLLD